MESAPHKVLSPRLEQEPVAFDDNTIIENDRELPAGRTHPIAKRGYCQHHGGDSHPGSAFLYGWPQCGQVARPSSRFFWQ
jgi:hypothetical protein